jgi:APA family basic amino acid/polyamine antiporter
MRRDLGGFGEKLTAAGIAVSTFGFLNLNLLLTPRLLQTMAGGWNVFAPLARIHPRYRTPTVAIVVFASWAIVRMLSRTFAQRVDYTVFGDWILLPDRRGTVHLPPPRRADATQRHSAGVSSSGLPRGSRILRRGRSAAAHGIIGTAPINTAKGALIPTIGLLV